MQKMSSRTAYEVQRDFALSCGLRSEIFWDSLAPSQADVLKQKIETLLPCNETNQKDVLRNREELFQNIWKQRKYTNKTLLSAIIYVLVAPEPDPNKAKFSENYSCHPIFRTRKCLSNGCSFGRCMIFIDEYARVYENWDQFIKKNVYEKGTLITPAKGVYTFNYRDEVELEFHPTPKSSKSTMILKGADNVLGVATVPLMAAAALPLALPVSAVASAVAVGGAAYSTLRSICRIHDRRKHCKSNALRNAEARNDWISMATGVAGLGASGATRALSYVGRVKGEVSLAAKIAVNGLNVTSLVVSSTGIVNNVYDLYTKNSVSSNDIMQLAASLVIFTHSVNNFKIANKISTKGSNSVVSAIKKETRAVFEKLSNETIKLNKTSSGKFDVIRTLNEIPYEKALKALHAMHQNVQVSAGVLANAKYIANYVLTGDGSSSLNLTRLAESYGGKFVQHIVNSTNFTDVVQSMVKWFNEEVFEFFMNLARTFIDETLDSIDQNLHTFISTECVLYRLFFQTINKYKTFSYKFLESKTQEIIYELESYFDSLNPNPNESNTTQVKCKKCGGFMLISKL